MINKYNMTPTVLKLVSTLVYAIKQIYCSKVLTNLKLPFKLFVALLSLLTAVNHSHEGRQLVDVRLLLLD